MKRLLVIFASIIVLLGAGFGIYYFFFSGSTPTLTPVTQFPSAGDQTPTTQTPSDTTQGAGTVVAPRLIKITAGPVAVGSVALAIAEQPATTLASSTASSTSVVGTPAETEVRYVERQSGNVFSFRYHDRVLTRISNKTLPGIVEATWTSDGARAFSRFLEKGSDGLERVDTYALPSSGTDGYFMEQDLSQVLVGPKNVVLSLRSGNSGSSATLSAADGTGARALFSSSISNLRMAFFGDNYFATTKGSREIAGYAFYVDGKGGAFTRELGPLTGLATLPNPKGSLVLYSYVDKGKVYTNVLDVASHSATVLPLATLAEKCAWDPSGTAIYCAVPTTLPVGLPDDWYQGVVSFSDRIWRIDLNTRIATLVVDPTQTANTRIDAISMTIDAASDVLLFTNKSDYSLWAYDL